MAPTKSRPFGSVSTKRTGYSIYNKHAKLRAKQNTLADLYPDLPKKQFDIIYADPPWDYNGKLQFDKSSASAERIDLSQNIFISSATFKYPTLKTDELMKLPINKIAQGRLPFIYVGNKSFICRTGLESVFSSLITVVYAPANYGATYYSYHCRTHLNGYVCQYG